MENVKGFNLVGTGLKYFKKQPGFKVEIEKDRFKMGAYSVHYTDGRNDTTLGYSSSKKIASEFADKLKQEYNLTENRKQESKMKKRPTKPVVERLRKKIRSMVESIIREEDYSDVDEDRKKRLTLVLKELDNMMDEIKIGPPYSINYEISTAIKLIEKAIQKIKR